MMDNIRASPFYYPRIHWGLMQVLSNDLSSRVCGKCYIARDLTVNLVQNAILEDTCDSEGQEPLVEPLRCSTWNKSAFQ